MRKDTSPETRCDARAQIGPPPQLALEETPYADLLFDFYCLPRSTAAGSPLRSRYEIWERGEAYKDSVTPSTYCNEYREHMVTKIASLLVGQGRVFSIGCGNAFVEADLVARGYYVQAIDCHAEAVVLAEAKGVEAFTRNFYDLPAGHLATFDVVYADGLLGHLYRPDRGLDRFFNTLAGLGLRSQTWLVLSNDSPARSEASAEPNHSVCGFWLLSGAYFVDTLTRHGFDVSDSYHFSYSRPVSGPRTRAICIARVAGDGR
jgi:SAM-dependent methyltransferase